MKKLWIVLASAGALTVGAIAALYEGEAPPAQSVALHLEGRHEENAKSILFSPGMRAHVEARIADGGLVQVLLEGEPTAGFRVLEVTRIAEVAP